VAIDGDPDMKKTYYNENEAEVTFYLCRLLTLYST